MGLKRLLALQPITARPRSWVQRLLRSARRQPARAALWALLVLGVPAILTASVLVVPVNDLVTSNGVLPAGTLDGFNDFTLELCVRINSGAGAADLA